MDTDLTFGMSPYLPCELAMAELMDWSQSLNRQSAQLTENLAVNTSQALRDMLAVIDSYYSNDIEGESKRPEEIEAGLAAEANHDGPLDICTSVARVSRELPQTIAKYENLSDIPFLCKLHYDIYSRLGSDHLVTSYPDGRKIVIQPGQIRVVDVRVGNHIACPHQDLPRAMAYFSSAYRVDSTADELRILRAAAAHHRVLWLHPFPDGNGRVARLYSQAYLMRAMGHVPLLCLSRGLALNQAEYYLRLRSADAKRQGPYDGRGVRSERGLLAWIEFFLEQLQNQLEFMSQALDINEYCQHATTFVEVLCNGKTKNLPKLHPLSARLLLAAFREGGLRRSEARELLGLSDQHCENLISALVAEDLLETGTNGQELITRFPAKYLEYLFPGLGPTSH